MKLELFNEIIVASSGKSQSEEIGEICNQISIYLRAHNFVKKSGDVTKITVTDASRKQSAAITAVNNGRSLYISLFKISAKSPKQKTRTNTFAFGKTKLFVHSSEQITFFSLRWCLKEFLRITSSKLTGLYGRTFSQLLEEEFYLQVAKEIPIDKENGQESVLLAAVKLYLSDPELFSMSNRLKTLLYPEIDPKEHLIQAILCISSGIERIKRIENERVSVLPIEKLLLASSNLYKKLLQINHYCGKAYRKNKTYLEVRGIGVTVSIQAARTSSNCITLRPSIVFDFEHIKIRLTWYSPTSFSAEKFFSSDWRHIFLATDSESHADKKALEKLTRRLINLNSYLEKINWLEIAENLTKQDRFEEFNEDQKAG